MEIIEPEIFKNQNIKAFFTKKNFDTKIISPLFLPNQKHTDIIWVLRNREEETIVADAVITNLRNIFIGVKVADCLPVLLYDPVNQVIGAVHAGWRGTAMGIIKKTIFFMKNVMGCRAENILIAFGPCIKGCCYEVGEEVLDAVCRQTPSSDFILRKNGKYHIDISKANIIQALSAGIRYENIWASDDCTYCKSHEFASYRFHGKKAGRQYGVIGML